MHNDDKNIRLVKVEIVRMKSIYNSEIIKIEEEGRGENIQNIYFCKLNKIFLILDCPE